VVGNTAKERGMVSHRWIGNASFLPPDNGLYMFIWLSSPHYYTKFENIVKKRTS
jgi:hypothetical protein